MRFPPCSLYFHRRYKRILIAAVRALLSSLDAFRTAFTIRYSLIRYAVRNTIGHSHDMEPVQRRPPELNPMDQIRPYGLI